MVHGSPSSHALSMRSQWNSRILTAFLEDFPNYRFLINHGKGVDEEAHRNDEWNQYLIPLSVSSGYFTREFWTVVYRKYGLRSCKIPHVLAQTRRDGRIPSRFKRCQRKYITDEARTELNLVREALRNRVAVWKRLRPW